MANGAGGAEFLFRIIEDIVPDPNAAQAAQQTGQAFESAFDKLRANLKAEEAKGAQSAQKHVAEMQAALQAMSAAQTMPAGMPVAGAGGQQALTSGQAAQSRQMLGAVPGGPGRFLEGARKELHASSARTAIGPERSAANEAIIAAQKRVVAAEREAATIAASMQQGYAQRKAYLDTINAELAADIAAEKASNESGFVQAETRRRANVELLNKALAERAVAEQLGAKQAQREAAETALRAQKTGALAGDEGYLQAETQRRLNTEKLNAELARRAVAEGVGTRQAEAEIAESQLQAQKNRRLRSASAVSVYQAERQTAAQLEASRQQRLAGDRAYMEANASVTAAKKQRAASEQAMLHEDTALGEQYQAAVRTETQNRLRAAALKARESAAFLQTGEGARLAAQQVEAEGVKHAIRRVETEARRVIEAQTLLGMEKAEVQATRVQLQNAVEQGTLQETLNSLTAQRVALEQRMVTSGAGMAAAAGGGAAGRGGGRGGGAGGGAMNFPGAFRTTLRYGVASVALFGVASAASEAVREATELDKIFNQLRRQFRSQFEGPEQATQQFETFKEEVFATARLTGEAADEVANVGFQLQGAFGGDTIRAIEETRDAMIAARVTGLDVNEVIDSFTALTQTFDGLTIERVTDATLSLQENLGVLAKETIQFTADLAPVGAELGFAAEKLAALGAVAQQTSGRSGGALAESFGRVLPQIQSNALEIISIFETLGTGVAETLTEAFGAGDVDAAFDVLLQRFNDLSQSARDRLVTALGGRREAQSIIGVLQQGSKVFEEYRNAQDSAGTTQEYFNDLQETLQQRVRVLGEEFRRLIQILFESGLKDFFTDFIDLLSTTVDLAKALVDVLSTLGGVLGPLSGPLTTAIQAGGLLYGGRALGRGVQRIRGGQAAAGATGGQALAGTGLAASGPVQSTQRGFARRQASRVGARFTELQGQGFRTGARSALPSVAGIGATLGVLAVSHVRQGIEEGTREGIADLETRLAEGGGGQIETELRRILRDMGEDWVPDEGDIVPELRSDLGPGSSVIEEMLRNQGLSDVQDELGQEAARNADNWQRALNAFNLSGEIDLAQAEIDLIVQQIYDNMRDGFNDGLSRIDADDDFRAEVADRAEGIFEGVDDSQNLVDESGLNDAQRAAAEQLASETQGDFSEGMSNIQERLNEAMDEGRLSAEIEAIEADLNDDEGDLEISDAARGVWDEFVDFIGRKGGVLDEVNDAADNAISNVESAVAGYELGIVSAAEVERVRATAIGRLRRLAESNPDEYEEDLFSALSDARDFAFDRITNELDTLESLEDLTGEAPTEDILGVIEESLDDPDSELSVDQRGDLADRAFEAMRARAQALADAAETEAERNRILSAMLQPEDIFLEAKFADLISSNQNFINTLSDFVDGEQEAITIVVEEIARVAVAQNVSAAVALDQLIANSDHLADLLSDFGPNSPQVAPPHIAGPPSDPLQGILENRDTLLGSAEENLEAYEGLLDGIAGPGGESDSDDAANTARELAEAELDLALALVEGDPVAEAIKAQEAANLAARFADGEAEEIAAQAEKVRADRQHVEALREITEAKQDLALASVENDPVAAARSAQRQADLAYAHATGEAERIRARAEGIRADRQHADALLDIEAAKRELLAAEVENDPVEAARAAQQEASVAHFFATGEAAKLRAQAEQIKSDRALQEAIFDVSQSEIELMQAIAEAAGDTVEAAELSIDQIKAQLERARAEGAGEAEVNSLKSDLVGAEASLRDATLADRREEFQFLADMGKITQGQLVGYLQSLLAIPDLTEDQIRDLQREIHNIRQEMGQDFQFNMPSNLDLPTTYEVRRLNQSGAAGQGYNDNRQINVNVTAETNASPDDIANAVTQAVGDPARSGTIPRRF